MPVVTADFSSDTGRKIKALHGMNSGPMTKVFTYDARPLFREAGFPFARLHDVEYPYGSGEFVDIPCIFRDFSADETRQESYNFALTDEYLKHCMEVGCEPFFRLGVSIEHAPVKRHVFPPADFHKWARICEHIIRHYTEGWANGFTWNIRYWELWNEPDLGAGMWLGTSEQFYELYCVSASHLKACFPYLKIGGCGFSSACCTFIENFFLYLNAKKDRIPLDFYSWHLYCTDTAEIVRKSRIVDALLLKYGYPDAENIFDEWNYMRDWSDQSDSYVTLKNHIGAAFCAAALCTMQTKTGIDAAMYFEADVVKEWCGIFTVDKMSIGEKKATTAPMKPFWAFKAFGELYRLGTEVSAVTDSDAICALAASDGEHAALMAVNYRGGDCELTFELSGLPEGEYEVRAVDEDQSFASILRFYCKDSMKLHLFMKDNSMILIRPCGESC